MGGGGNQVVSGCCDSYPFSSVRSGLASLFFGSTDTLRALYVVISSVQRQPEGEVAQEGICRQQQQQHYRRRLQTNESHPPLGGRCCWFLATATPTTTLATPPTRKTAAAAERPHQQKNFTPTATETVSDQYWHDSGVGVELLHFLLRRCAARQVIRF